MEGRNEVDGNRKMNGLRSRISGRIRWKQALYRTALSAVIIFGNTMAIPRHSTAEKTQAANPYEEGLVLMRREDYGKAAEILEEARKRTPDNVRVLYQLGLAYYNLEKIDTAVELWSKAAKKLPNGDVMKATLLDIIKRGGERKVHLEKKARLEKMLNESHWSVEDAVELAEIYKKDGHYNKSKKLFRQLIEARPDDPRAYAGLAAIEYHEGRILRAELNYGLALGLSPDDPGIKAKMQDIKEELEALRNIGYENMVKGSH